MKNKIKTITTVTLCFASFLLCLTAVKGDPRTAIINKTSKPYPLSSTYHLSQKIPNTANTLPMLGLWVQFENLLNHSGWWPGQLIQNWYEGSGGSIGDVRVQLAAIQAMGVNTITVELRSSDQNDVNEQFPDCNINPVLGLYWPNPPQSQLDNLDSFFTFVESYGMKVNLVLVNTHMEEQPPTNSMTWLGSILNVVKNHTGLSSVIFNGDAHTIDLTGDGIPDSCGGQSETPLWNGPHRLEATYVKWAISYAMGLGLPSRKLSPGISVGWWITDTQTENGGAEDGHFWAPISIIKGIWDELGVPNNQRLYALSLYEHRKCAGANGDPTCVDEGPHQWTNDTLRFVYNTIGYGNGARVMAYEMGNATPVQPEWTTSQAFQSLYGLMAYYGMEGGCLWRWVSYSDDEDNDPTLATPIKLRCQANDNSCYDNFVYTPVKDVVECYYTGTCRVTTPRPRPTPHPRP